MADKQFYIEFGKILYALAMADGKIQEEEKREIFRDVNTELAPVEDTEDEFGTDLAFYALFSFESEDDQIDSVEEASKSFLIYLDNHEKELSKDLKQACTNILNKLAKASGKVTSSEKKLLDEVLSHFHL